MIGTERSVDTAEDDRDIGAAGAATRAFVIPAREDIEIARGVRAALAAHA